MLRQNLADSSVPETRDEKSHLFSLTRTTFHAEIGKFSKIKSFHSLTRNGVTIPNAQDIQSSGSTSMLDGYREFMLKCESSSDLQQVNIAHNLE